MSWLLSIVVGVLTAAAGCVGAGILGSFCAKWYRISSFEGGAGYYVVGIALLGLFGGFVIGVVASRIVAASASPGFLKALGSSTGVIGGILVLIAGFAWLAADFPPKLGGKELVVEVEARMPQGFAPPTDEAALSYWYVTITADTGARHQSSGPLEFQKARQEGGRWVVPATVFLGTSDPGKSLGVVVKSGVTQFFRFPLAGKPTRADMQWSPWLTDAHEGNLQEIPESERAAARYRVQYYVPPPPEPPGPTQEELDAKKKAEDDAAFAALTPESPATEWLRFTRYGVDEERRAAAANALAKRPNVVAEMTPVILGDDHDLTDVALRAISLMKPPPPGFGPVISELGRRIVEEIKVVNATTAEEDPSYQKAADASVRFVGWSEAARTIHGRDGVDLRAEMKEILELAKVRTESIVMRDVVRIASYYTKEWSGGAPK
jgi:hypothetical protein